MDTTVAILGFGATIVATVLTGIGVVFGLVRYINATRLEMKQDNQETRKELKDEIAATDKRLSEQMKESNERLSAEIKATDARLSGQISGVDTRLSGQIKEVDTRLSEQISGVDAKLTSQVTEVRQASESAHSTILSELSAMKAQQAAHTERLNCIDKSLQSDREDDVA